MIRPLLNLDWESFYSTAEGYTLKKMSMLEYIRDPRFKAFGFSYKWVDGKAPSRWISGAAQMRDFFASVDWSKTSLLGQNVKFDGAILAWHYGVIPKSYVDTLAMSRAVLGHRLQKHSLASIAAYFGLPAKGFLPTDGVHDLTPTQERELAEYCNNDVDLCEGGFLRLEPDFPESQYSMMDWTIRCFTQPMLRLDEAKLKEVHIAEKARRTQVIELSGVPKPILASNKLFPEELKRRGFEVPMKQSPTAKKRGESKQIPALAVGDPEFLDMLQSENEELRTLCEARAAAKSTTLETRSEKFLNLAKFGAFPFDIHFSGAKQTHRFSGGSGAGGNPQNLKKKSGMRESVRASEGYKLLVGDFAAIELREQAWLANDRKLINSISEGRRPYSEFASKVYGRTITKADQKEDHFGKCAVLGLGYGMGPAKFKFTARVQTGIVIDQQESERVVYLYRDEYRMPDLWQALNDFIPHMAEGHALSVPGAMFLRAGKAKITLPSGLTLQYTNLRPTIDGDWVYDTFQGNAKVPGISKLYGGKLLENICQALSQEICKVAIQRLIDAGIRAVGQVHDEILVVAKDADVAFALSVMQRAMEQPMPWWPSLKLKGEIGVGNTWAEAKP